MKRRFAIILAIMVLLTSVFVLNTVSLTANAEEEIVWDTHTLDFTSSKWFEDSETPDAKELDLAVVGASGFHCWVRTWNGNKITSDDKDGQYFLDYYKEDPSDEYESDDRETQYYEMPMENWTNFSFVTNKAKPGKFKYEIVLKKGDTWVEGDNEFDLFIMFWNNPWVFKQDVKEAFLNGTPDENGWVKASIEMEIPEEYGSISEVQLLFRHRRVATRQLKIQSISMSTAVDLAKLPEISQKTFTFDGSSPADFTATLALKGFRLSNVKIKGATKVLAKDNWSLSNDAFTLKKEYLKTLENGDYTFVLTTLGGTCEFTVTVTNAGASTGGGGCGSIITATSAVLTGVLLLGATLVFKKKH